jgi:hypothetical protein
MSAPFVSSHTSDRRQALAQVERDLALLDGQLDATGHRQLDDAAVDIDDIGRSLTDTADRFVAAAGHGLGAGMNAALAAGHATMGGARAAVATSLAVGSVAAEGAEAGADFVGRATQLLGRAFIGAGNGARDVADIDGPQLLTVDVAGDRFARTWSDALREESGAQLQLASTSYLHSIAHVAGAVANGVLATVELGRAALGTLAVARETLAVAKGLADAGVIEVAERAVELAGVAVRVVDRAVDFGEQGVDAAGAALQSAGRALVVAGNAVNTARGVDTRVLASP